MVFALVFNLGVNFQFFFKGGQEGDAPSLKWVIDNVDGIKV